MDDPVAAHVDGHMAAVADDISRFGILDSAGYSSSYMTLCVGGMRKVFAEMSVDRHNES